MSTTHLYPRYHLSSSYLSPTTFPPANYHPSRAHAVTYHVLLAPRLDTRFKGHARSIVRWAAKRNIPEIFKRALDLVERPPSFSSPENKGRWLGVLLDGAVRLGRTEFVRALLEYGVNLHECCGGGTPLSNAVKLGNLEIATLLLEAGTDPDRPGCVCEGFRNPAEIAWDFSSHNNMMTLLLKHGAAFRPPHLSPGE